MAKTTAPLLSFGGSGQIGKTQVYSKWRGIPYARRYVIPANPQSDSQQATRGVFSWLNAVWKIMNANAQAPWTLFAKGRPFFNRNAFIKANLAALRGTDADPVTVITALQASPGANAGLAISTVVASDATGHVLDVTITVPTLPAGWTMVKGHGIAIVQQNANSDKEYTSVYDDDATASPALSFSMGAAGTYVYSVWLEYTKPDGTTAFSPSVSGAQVLA